MKRTCYIITLIVACTLSVKGQFIDAGSYFRQSPISFNPAATGHNDVFTISWNFRNQWLGIPGAPTNQHFAFHAPMPKENVAVGLLVGSETEGIKSKTNSYVSYAYRIHANNLHVSFGIRGGLNTYNEDQSAFAEQTEDPLLQGNEDSYLIPNMGAGIMIYSSNYFLGFSLPEFFHYDYTNEKIDYDISQLSYLITAGGSIKVAPFMAVQPSVMFGIDKTERFSQFYNLNLLFLEKYMVGAVQKLNPNDGFNFSSFSSLVMFRANPQTDIGIGYDFNLGDFANYSNGSLEVFLQYQFSYKIKTASPRSF
ncbi:MAG: type IX secretion system membrane protein PorP/SprF [Bacteroidetes bacterium]|jgi:type IX secretion system PorP/SprF family membrane protein|nr:type IX secretion system membrane protein PorP/SprF [Bacteroidota bacterium]